MVCWRRFCDYTFKELRCKQQGGSCGFGVVDAGLYLSNLNLDLLLLW